MSSQLTEMVRDELITRHTFKESPPRVEYRLTDKGKGLVPVFETMADWGRYLVADSNQED